LDGVITNEFVDGVLKDEVIDSKNNTMNIIFVNMEDHFEINIQGKIGDSGSSVWKIDGDKYVLIGIARAISPTSTYVAKIQNCFTEAHLEFNSILFKD